MSDPIKRVQDLKKQLDGALEGLNLATKANQQLIAQMPPEMQQIINASTRRIQSLAGKMDLAGAIKEMQRAAKMAEKLRETDGVQGNE